jgi:hypothetical protein
MYYFEIKLKSLNKDVIKFICLLIDFIGRSDELWHLLRFTCGFIILEKSHNFK